MANGNFTQSTSTDSVNISAEKYQRLVELQDVAHAQSDHMHDILAMMRGAKALHPDFDDVGRLLVESIKKLDAVHDSFQPYI